MRTRGYRSLATALPLLTIVGACASQADDANVVRRTRSALIGPNVVPDSFPDSSVIVTLEDDIGSRCKGTLITPRLILTAAHCVVGTNEEVPKAPLGPHATVYTAIGANGLAVIGNIGRRIPRVSAPVSAADAGLDFGLLEIDAGADSLSQESWDRLFALRIRRPTFAPLAGSESGAATFTLAESLAIGGFTGDDRHDNARLPIPLGTSVEHGDGFWYFSAFYGNNLGGETQQGDSGGPLFRTVVDGRDVVAVSSLTLNIDYAPYMSFADVTSPANAQWIRDKAGDATRSTRWNQAHGGRRWIGEVDYLGACDVARDADCDHWYTWHDNCPATFNPAQDDADDDGRGDACDSCPRVAEQQPGRNCNVEAERARGVAELGDACDPVPCADIYIDRRRKSNENCVPNPPQEDGTSNGLACTADFARPFLMTDPLPSRDDNGASMDLPEVATARRFCQSAPPLFDCMARENIADELLDLVEPPTPNSAVPWHRISIGTTMWTPPRGMDAVLSYDANVSFSSTSWRYATDYAYWTSGSEPMIPVGDCAANDVSCLRGHVWLHARTDVGVAEHGSGLANSYEPWRPLERLGYCPTIRLPEWMFGVGAAVLDFRGSLSDTALARRGELPWAAFERSAYRVIDLDEAPYARLIGSSYLGVVASLRTDGSAVAASAGANPCSGVDVDLALSDAIASYVWAPMAEPRPRMGTIDERVFGVALDPSGRRVMDTAVEIDGRAALGSQHGLGDWIDAAEGPPSLTQFAAVFSQVAGGVFVVGGRDVGDSEHHGRIFFRPVGGPWEQLSDGGIPIGRVVAATYAYGDRQLWIADVAGDNQARILRIDPALGKSEVVLFVPNHERSLFFSVDRDGSALLFVGQGSFYDTFRFALDPQDAAHHAFQIQRYARTEARLTRIPLVDDRAYQFVEAVPENGTRTLRIRNSSSLTRVCCSGLSCGAPDVCALSTVGGLL